MLYNNVCLNKNVVTCDVVYLITKVLCVCVVRESYTNALDLETLGLGTLQRRIHVTDRHFYLFIANKIYTTYLYS